MNPESKPAFVRRGFDSIAARYDLLNDLMTAGLHRRWKREAIQRLSLRPGMRVLDFCSGTGDLALRAVKAIHPGGQVAALDFSPGMMAEGRKRTQSLQSEQTLSWIALSWIGGDASRLPFLDDSFDGAVVGFGLRNVASIEIVLQEVHRVLRPGAWFVTLDTAEAEWRAILPFFRFYMNWIVPMLGKLFAGSKGMYAYLSSSAAAFQKPSELARMLQQSGFSDTGYAFRPRILGGAALVWGRKPKL
jgi:demethylmenaquinone methyltransferase / 2-methoxy-6-polyprenyl-1,4-benzoquinol methylase